MSDAPATYREIAHRTLNGAIQKVRGLRRRSWEASRKLALFLAKNHNLRHAFFSRGMSPALGRRGTGETNVAGSRFRQLVYNLRWRPEIFLFESAVTH
jgi:hypothetical protein